MNFFVRALYMVTKKPKIPDEITKNEKLLEQVSKSNFGKAIELLDEGADINYVNQAMCNPLLIAIANNDKGFVEFLLSKKANPNPDPTRVYTTPLNLAIDSAVQATNNNAHIRDDSIDMIQILLKFGANPNIRDRDGEAALEFARDYHMPAEKLLASIGLK